jgi:archaeal cell division control protein 6
VDKTKQKGIFDDLLESRCIFRNKETLRHSYNPKKLPHREKEIKLLASILVSALKGESPSNILVYGITGTGKTAVIKYVGAELERKAVEMAAERGNFLCGVTDRYLDHESNEELSLARKMLGPSALLGEETGGLINRPVNFIYTNCQYVNTQYGVLTNISNHFIDNWSKRVPFTGWPIEEVHKKLIEYLDQAGGITIVILDEIDKLVLKDRSGEDTLYILARLNEELSNSKVSLIGISNELKFMELLESRVNSSLGPEEINFAPYDATQLKDILSERAKEAFNADVLDPGVVPLCSALAAQEHGDARRALDLLRISAEIAERNGFSTVSEALVRQAKDQIERDNTNDAIRSMPTQSKLILLSIIHNTVRENKKITTGDVYETYKDLTRETGTSELTFRRVTDLISDLNTLGLIDTRVVSYGRQGRTRLIELTVNPEETKTIILEDSYLKKLEDYKPPMQRNIELYSP